MPSKTTRRGEAPPRDGLGLSTCDTGWLRMLSDAASNSHSVPPASPPSRYYPPSTLPSPPSLLGRFPRSLFSLSKCTLEPHVSDQPYVQATVARSTPGVAHSILARRAAQSKDSFNTRHPEPAPGPEMPAESSGLLRLVGRRSSPPTGKELALRVALDTIVARPTKNFFER